MRRIISSVDLGSDTIKFLVAEVIKEKIHVLFSLNLCSKGIKNGLIINNEFVIDVLKKGYKEIEENLGIKINKTLVNIDESNCTFLLGEGYSTITNAEKIIGGNDIVRALQASVYNKIPNDKELVTIIPIEFIINDDEIVKDPKNIVADKLGVRSVLIMSPKKNAYNVIKCFDNIGVEITDITYGIIGDYYVVKDEETEINSGAIIDIGAEKTVVGIFNKGILVNCESIALGGMNIDNDIAFIYKVKVEKAKELKEKIALAHSRLADANVKEKLVNNLNEEVSISQFELSEIAESRLREILNLAKKQINLLTKKEISYIIVTGGLTEIEDFNLLIEECFGKNVVVKNIHELGIRNNKYSVALGLIKYFDKKLQLRDKKYSALTMEAEKELSEVTKKVNVSSDSLLGKIFGYFFDN